MRKSHIILICLFVFIVASFFVTKTLAYYPWVSEDYEWRSINQRAKIIQQQRKLIKAISAMSQPAIDPNLQKAVVYLLKSNQETTKRINKLEKIIKKLEKRAELNYKLEKIHWSKVIEIDKQIKLLRK